MSDIKQVCGDCTHFHAIRIPTGNGALRETAQAHCLARTIYAKNKPGNPIYPPGAKTAELPFAQHQVVIVRREQKAPDCMDFKPKGDRK